MCLVGMKRVRYLSILWNQYSIIWIEIRSGEADSRVSDQKSTLASHTRDKSLIREIPTNSTVSFATHFAISLITYTADDGRRAVLLPLKLAPSPARQGPSRIFVSSLVVC
ncbi:hypothetical protein EVAR_102991_1 [Eumeta japonica]|uniref:Uncharacterized protein n=1 Tax=Eumeta variegata TaxID=151549 RepID=A0A4C1UPQ0_EUMVA|nr:hypothetical protein EVAR_102991_1 [Eumeta japonica]